MKSKFHLPVLFLLLFNSLIFSADIRSGQIFGSIIDIKSGQPLVGVNIVILNSESGTTTDLNGFYQLKDLPPGSYNLMFSMIGYKKVTKINVEVHPGNETHLAIELVPEVIEVEEARVTASAFRKSTGSVVSERRIDLGELRTDPGSAGDIQRSIQAMPSVTSSVDQINEIIVRGGNAGENLFIMDEIEIDNPNHYANQGMTGGAINLINSEFVREIDFYAGAFPATFGDKTSSVMNIQYREGSSERFQGTIDMNMAGAGGSLEGPIGSKGSFLFTAHKSYLDLIIQQTGLTAIPYYWNAQGKMVYNLNRKNKLIFNTVYGNDKIHLEANEDDEWGTGDMEDAKTRHYMAAGGLTLQSLLGENSFSKVTGYFTQSNFFLDVNYLSEGKNPVPVFNNDDTESVAAMKAMYSMKLSNGISFQAGGQVKNITLDYNSYLWGDTLFLYQAGTDNIIDTLQYFDSRIEDTLVTSIKSSGYVNLTLPIGNKIEMIVGLRAQYFDLNDEFVIEPRIGLTTHLSNVMNLNFALGRHHQSPEYFHILDNASNDGPVLKSKYADQVVAGMEYFPAEDMKFSIEAYVKQYQNAIGPYTYFHSVSDTSQSYPTYLVNEGEIRSKGVELYFHKKLFSSWYGIFSYSYSNAEAFDPRNDKWYPWDMDHRNIINLTYGKKWVRGEMNSGILKYIGLNSDQFTASFRYRFSGGLPYTQLVYDPNLRMWLKNEAELNTMRYDNYSRFDFILQWKRAYKNKYFVSYLNIQNIFNRDNVWRTMYNKDGTTEDIMQYKLFPVGGFILEF